MTGQRTVAESDPATALVRRDDFIELLSGSLVDEIYEVDSRLGAGAMGEVYAARHLKLGKRVAIKVIGSRLSEDADAIERFAQEARVLAQIQHPAIVTVDHVGELPDGRAYFIMEFLRGETLFDRLGRGRVPFPEALRIFDQMARGLDAAHAQGVTHRDLKPENTFLANLANEAPVVKLLDFGLAKLKVDVDFRAERTQSGVAIGTPMYMSPEQARGPDIDHRTDIYALGCVGYELFLGRVPFEHARTMPELFAAHLHEAPPLPRSIWPEIPPQLDLVLFAMLAKNADHRPTLAQVRTVLTTIATARASAPPRPEGAATMLVAPRPRRTTALMVAITVAVLGLIAILAVAIGDNQASTAAGIDHLDAARSGTIAPAIATDAAVDAYVAPARDAAPLHLLDAPVTRPLPHVTVDASTTATRPVPHGVDAGPAVAPPVDAEEASPVDVPADAAPPAIEHPIHRPQPPIPKITPVPDRNQTINPFAKKRPTTK